jgi:YD repeat-containing protein
MYSGRQNNGQITQMVHTVTGATVSYQYDALKRLVSAAGALASGSGAPAWTQTYQYDGFGNLTAKVLNGTTTALQVNGATNQLMYA